MYVSIGQAAVMMGICESTLRRWDDEGVFVPCYRTKGGHRRYAVERLEQELGRNKVDTYNKQTVLYARVSSHDQKLDLKRQEQRLIKHCKEDGYQLISDLGSGLNYNKRGLKKLIKMLCLRQVKELVLTHKDRLLRFGSALIFQLCEFFGTKVVILDAKASQTFEQELVADVIEIMTVFTARMYGKRAHQNKKAINA